MQFTHYTPGLPHGGFCSILKTLQIFSIKLTRLDGGLEFPLSVYGVVAIRDMVDRNRNILFSRDISEAQELKQSVCMRAILVDFRFVLLDCTTLLIHDLLAGSLSALDWPVPCNPVYGSRWH
jgi:hypothetical protein